jgi:hypothetical protein
MSKHQTVAAGLILGLICFLPLESAAAAPDIEAVCAATACRAGGYETVLRLDDKHFTTVPVTKSPYILDDGSLLLFPGESLAIQFDIENDQPVRPRFVRRFAPKFPMQIEKDGKPVANPSDNGLPAVPMDEHKVLFDTLPPNTVVLSYGQLDGKPDMMLTIDHSLPKRFKVAAVMQVPDGKSYDSRATTSCPIQPHLTLFEHWPHRIGPMILKAPRLLSDTEDAACT